MDHHSTKSTFDNDVYIYIERKEKLVVQNLSKFGKKKFKNDVLVLDINNKGILVKAKNFYNKDDMNKINFHERYRQASIIQKIHLFITFLSYPKTKD